MSYFSEFPLLYYSEKKDGNYKLAVDILRRVHIREGIKDNASLYYEYKIKDMDTPEIIADKIYGSPEYHWIILMANNMIDPFYDWPLNQRKFESFLEAKYGKGEEDKPHHYELADGTWTNGPIYLETPEGDTIQTPDGDDFLLYNITTNVGTPVAVSNRQYEEKLNEAKRAVRLIKPEIIQDILSEFRKKINQ